ncbi:hypothetical protein SADUNF_Sadunf18G0046800 [Salix dunnii]|uniref:Uncharacterized protein n=1 Tax=Salix dunnii TaxID=1413687 RepID=A0A835MIQ9_9ROSI|nr:hypothetical protein SADUNF_Sadunf18G0046800 [Salix dunnii]
MVKSQVSLLGLKQIQSNWLFTFEEIQMMDFSRNKFSATSTLDQEFNNGDVKQLPVEPFLVIQNIEIKIYVLAVDNNELSFNYHLSSNAGIDLSDNLLHSVPSLEKMQHLRALDLSHNSVSGQTPRNISRLKELVLSNLSYNSLSGFIPWKEGYRRFPGAFIGNPDLCVESRRVKCNPGSLPAVPRKSFEETEGPIFVWIFCVSAFVSFYFLCCHFILFHSSKKLSSSNENS